MQLRNRVVAITGAGTGIGRALAERFAAEGACHVAIADRDFVGARMVAASVGGSAHHVDVTDEADVQSFIQETEKLAGPIDLFCSNAGVLLLDPDMEMPAETPDLAWRASLDVNLMAHIYAARAVLPSMLARGEGYLLNTVSAAGLLTMVGAAAYAVSKHAAIGLAESFSIAYGDRGVRVSVLCPQAVRTPMTADRNFGADRDGIIEPEAVADCVVYGLAAERFLILPHPKVQDYMGAKVADTDRWLETMRRIRRSVLGPEKAPGSASLDASPPSSA